MTYPSMHRPNGQAGLHVSPLDPPSAPDPDASASASSLLHRLAHSLSAAAADRACSSPEQLTALMQSAACVGAAMQGRMQQQQQQTATQPANAATMGSHRQQRAQHGSHAGACAADLDLLLMVADQVVGCVLRPPPWVPSDTGPGGDAAAVPEEVLPGQQQAAAAYLGAAADAMQALGGMLAALPLPALHDGTRVLSSSTTQQQEGAGSGRGPGRASASGTPSFSAAADAGVMRAERGGGLGGVGAAGVTIEEIGDSEAEAELRQQRTIALLHRSALLAAGFMADERLPSPWQRWCCSEGEAASEAAARAAEAAAEQLLHTLAGLTSSSSSRHASSHTAAAAAGSSQPSELPGGTSLSLLGPHEASRQCLLAATLPSLLPRLRRGLVAAQPHLEPPVSALAPKPGPEAKAEKEAEARWLGLASAGEQASAAGVPSGAVQGRVLLARRMAALVRACRHPFIGDQVPVLLPTLLAILDDPSAAVSVQGVWALHHVATEALSADLLWQRDLLLNTSYRLVIGCGDSMWAAVLPAAIATVSAVEGRDSRAPGYHTLASELLTEAERCIHKRARRLPFLHYCGALVEAMGLATTRHLARLMPLVLESLHAYDAPSRAAASRLLLTITRCTWVRQRAHAPLLWRHMVSAFVRDAPAAGDWEANTGVAASRAASGAGGEAAAVGAGGGGGCGEGVGSSHGSSDEQEVVANVLLLARLLAEACASEALWQAVAETEAAEAGPQVEGVAGAGAGSGGLGAWLDRGVAAGLCACMRTLQEHAQGATQGTH